MALANHELRGLIGIGDNDNLLRAHPFQVPAGPVVAFPRRIAEVEVTLPTLRTRLDRDSQILWTEMRHPERACYTPGLVEDSRALQLHLMDRYAASAKADIPFKWLVWTSATPGVFSLGGDLTTFTDTIRNRDRVRLASYAHRCIDVLHDNYHGLHLPILSVALVTGDAIGGGFESMLSNDIVVAERTAKFGLPEVLFGLFPGMGGYSFLKRRLGERDARALMEDGRTRSAEELHALGLIDVLCDQGQGESALRSFIAQHNDRFESLRVLRRACKRVDPLTHGELTEITDMWVDLALQLGPTELRRMDCLARVQQRRRDHA